MLEKIEEQRDNIIEAKAIEMERDRRTTRVLEDGSLERRKAVYLVCRLQNTDANMIECGGHSYRLPQELRIDIYNALLEACGGKSVSKNVYDSLEQYVQDGEQNTVALVYAPRIQCVNGCDAVEVRWFVRDCLVNREKINGTIFLNVKQVDKV